MRFLNLISALFLLSLSATTLFAVGPDLIPEVGSIEVRKNQNVSAADVAEGCADATTGRDLLRFSTITHNIGAEDVYLGDPKCPDCGDEPGAICGNPIFMCSAADGHGHGHLIGFADYRLFNESGDVEAAAGHKEGFCLRDNFCVSGVSAQYNCSDQGLTAGCSDLYSSSLGCQYIDITGVPPGRYLLRISINAEGNIPEVNYGNNLIEIPVEIPAPPVLDLAVELDPLKVEYLDSMRASALAADCGLLTPPRAIARISGSLANTGTLPFHPPDNGAGIFSVVLTHPDFSEETLSQPLLARCIADQSCQSPVATPFSCENQGLNPGCSLTFSQSELCDFIDLSAHPPGGYGIKVVVNSIQEIEEANFVNNAAAEQLELCSELQGISVKAGKRRQNLRRHQVTGWIADTSFNPIQAGFNLSLNGDEVEYIDLNILGAKELGCLKRDRWMRVKGLGKNRGKKSWRYKNRSGFLDPLCTVPLEKGIDLGLSRSSQRLNFTARFFRSALLPDINSIGAFWRLGPASGSCAAGGQVVR